MTVTVSVQDGTNAGTRRPFNGRAADWACDCWVTVGEEVCPDCDGDGDVLADHGHYEPCDWCGGDGMVTVRRPKLNPGFLANCTACGERRPQ